MSSRWLRFLKIALTFMVVAPLVAGTVLFLFGAEYARPPLHRWISLWLTWVIHFGYVFGAPISLLVGIVFGACAVFANRSRLWVAMAPAFAMLTLAQIPAGAAIWQWGAWFALAALLATVIPTAVAWRLTRRWHRAEPDAGPR